MLKTKFYYCMSWNITGSLMAILRNTRDFIKFCTTYVLLWNT